jgi:ribonuclease HII
MADRVDELLDFDLALIDAVVEGRPFSGVVQPGTCFLDLRRVSESIRVVGFDEAGRGALAGPVVVACAHVDLGGVSASSGLDREGLTSALAGLDDSKRLTPRRRESLYDAIVSNVDWGLGCASASVIDRRGIVRACQLAARRAFARLSVDPDFGLFDRGLSLTAASERGSLPQLQLTRGDARSLHIAAASILAKVGRDAIMDRLEDRFPGYELSKHKGYGTAAHRDAIRHHGPSIVHRRSFCTRIGWAESQSC